MAGFRERIETQAHAISFRHLLLFALLIAVLAVWNGYNSLYGTWASPPQRVEDAGEQRDTVGATQLLNRPLTFIPILRLSDLRLPNRTTGGTMPSFRRLRRKQPVARVKHKAS